MKVKELLEELKKADLESEVVFVDSDMWLMSVLIVEEEKAITEDDENITFCILKAKPDEEDEEDEEESDL